MPDNKPTATDRKEGFAERAAAGRVCCPYATGRSFVEKTASISRRAN
jgi:hypothetical protein